MLIIKSKTAKWFSMRALFRSHTPTVIIQRHISSLSSTNTQNPPFRFNFNSFLQACSSSKSINQVKQLHQRLIVHLNGSHNNSFFITKLIQTYADCDDLRSAHLLLNQLSQPNIFAFTSILSFHSRHSDSYQCIQTYAQLRLKGILPDGYVFPKVLKACAHSTCLHVGIVVHKDVIVFGWESSLRVCNSALDMYSKCGDVGSATQVFDEMRERDVFSWNSMMSCFVCNGLFEKALELFGLMGMDGCECDPDVVTWNTVMAAYCRMGLIDEASRVFQIIKDPNIISWTTLISGYSGFGKHDVALETFRNMVNVGMVFPDVDALSSILVSCRFLGAFRSGREIHGYGLKNLSVNNNAFYKSAGAALLTLYAGCSRLYDAEKVFHRMNKSDVVTWNAMISGFIDTGLGRQALECFREMKGRGVKIDQTTISTILAVCDLGSGKQIHAYVRKSDFSCLVGVYNALIHMYAINGYLAYAYSVFSTMVKKDLVSWNTIIGGFGMHGLGQTAVKLLQEMSVSGISPDSVTFSSALSACSHSGLLEEGIELFYRMTTDFGLTPVKEHFSCVIDMLARAGRLEDAVQFINQMPLEPDKYIWGALLAACQERQNISVGKLAAEKLIDLEPHEAGHYVTLSNLYSRTGRWDDAARIRTMMEGQGLLKPSGHSWVGTGS